jgi:hypothetical protein
MSATHISAGEPSPPLRPLRPVRTADAPEALRDEVAHLHEAIKSQRDIGMAIGLLSARFGVSTEQAWRTMLRVSQDSNTKVREVARVLVATHDGSADAEAVALLATFVSQLPASGWPSGPWTGQDRAL